MTAGSEINCLHSVQISSPPLRVSNHPGRRNLSRSETQIRSQYRNLIPQPYQHSGDGANLDGGSTALLEGIVGLCHFKNSHKLPILSFSPRVWKDALKPLAKGA